MPVNQNSGRTWINFKDLRANLKAEEVLRLYEVAPNRKGDQHHSPCPLPSHTGNNNTPSFSVNLERGIFQCFGCKAKGNMLEFAALMEGVDPADGNALRKVAIKLQKEFFSGGQKTHTTARAPIKEAAAAPSAPKPVESKVIVNAPLDFDLKGLEGSHPDLSGRGYTSQTIAYFGVGFCSRGLLKDRIAIPLHDDEGKLIGYAGRVADERNADAENPCYLYPTKRERNGTVLDFDRSLFLYNGSRIKPRCTDLVVVQDFPAVWWLTQHGYPTVVAVMGDRCSPRQIELIVGLVRPGGWVWVMCDGNENGDRLALLLLFHISLLRPVRRVDCGRGKRPTDLTADELKNGFAE